MIRKLLLWLVVVWLFSLALTAQVDDSVYVENGCLKIIPQDTVIVIGSNLHFQALKYCDSTHTFTNLDSGVTWSIKGMNVGTLSDEGTLEASGYGYAVIEAKYGDLRGSAFVIVDDSASADSVLNTVTITRTAPNKDGYSVMKELQEGEIWVLSGLPKPLNILNGSKIYIPIKSLNSDIRIHIDIPPFAEIRGDSLTFQLRGVINGVDFKVFVDDSLAEPFYFNKDIIVGVVFKRGLINKRGIDPSTLSLYYAYIEDDSVTLDTLGLTYVTVDSNLNRIYSNVPHFTSLVVKGDESVETKFEENIDKPMGYRLYNNYPNPFNAATKIRYYIPENSVVKIAIYDLLGNEVTTLVNEYAIPGNYEVVWNGTDRLGRAVPSGVYIYKLIANQFSATGKMLLLK